MKVGNVRVATHGTSETTAPVLVYVNPSQPEPKGMAGKIRKYIGRK